MPRVGSSQSPAMPLAPPLTPDEQSAWLDLVRQNGLIAPPLIPILQKLLHDNADLLGKLDRLQEIQESLREKVKALTEPEHYPGVITDVRRNGKLAVEVVVANTRLDVAVHPEVDQETLRIGAKARLTQARNCVVEVDEEPPAWSEIGEFVGRSGDDHLLLRHQGTLRRLRPVEDLCKAELGENDLVGFDPNAGLAFAKVEIPDKSNLLLEEAPRDRFEELGGLDQVISRLKRFVEFRLKNPEVARRYGIATKRGILFHGPPGNGKTKLARCLAHYISELTFDGSCRFMAISGSSDYSMWLGQTEQNLRARFQAVRKMALTAGVPVVMFFDEIDAIGRRRGTSFGGDAPDRILATFLSELDGISQLGNVIIIGATNRRDILDPGLTRAGRLGDEQILIPPPNRLGARAILERYLIPLPLAGEAESMVQTLLSRLYSLGGDYADVARVMLRDGRKISIAGKDLVSGALLENAVRKAADVAADREVQTGAVGVTLDDLAASLDEELRSAASSLSPGNVRGHVTRLPQDVDPVAVEQSGRFPSPGLYLRHA